MLRSVPAYAPHAMNIYYYVFFACPYSLVYIRVYIYIYNACRCSKRVGCHFGSFRGAKFWGPKKGVIFVTFTFFVFDETKYFYRYREKHEI